jgi:diguanylate cyclase (GGDEF)-like protein
MRLFDRHDIVLIVGLTVSVGVAFARPVANLLEFAHQVDTAYGLALVPALGVLVVVLGFHYQRKRNELRSEAAAAAAEAREAGRRIHDLELLVVFGQALARALDLDAIRTVVLQHLPRLAHKDEGWVLTSEEGSWHALVAPPGEDSRDVELNRERLATLALDTRTAAGDDERLEADGVNLEDQVCFPMMVGRRVVGVLGMPEGVVPLTLARRRILSAAAAMLAIAVKNADLFYEIRENSLRDGLTGCFNRAHGLHSVEAELRRAQRTRLPISLLLMDLDHFKDVNDRCGHLCGDAVLAEVGRRLNRALRLSDLKCRYGGEEFLLLLPDTPLAGALQVAETVRRTICASPILWGEESLTVTASFGVTVALPDELDSEAVIARADAAMYQAKGDGRNCVRVSGMKPAAA